MRLLAGLAEVASGYGAIVLDQWGVLHDGTRPYPGAAPTLEALRRGGARLAVLSNSGKRAQVNAARIAGMGIDPALFEVVMTSGEALWRDLTRGALPGIRRVYPVTGAPGDAEAWLDGLSGVALAANAAEADAIVLMGLPEDADMDAAWAGLAPGLGAGRPLLCSNPDLASPRAGGRRVPSPGALAARWEAAGGAVRWYGKPHGPIFAAAESALALPPARLLMVGDSLAHDVAGAKAAGWAAALVAGGLHAGEIGADLLAGTARLAGGGPRPDYVLARLG